MSLEGRIRIPVAFLLMISITFLLPGCSSLPAEHTVVKADKGEIRIPLKDVKDGRVHFFTYKKSGKRINFFVRTDGAGKLSTYFDSCFTCHKFKKGYRVEGTDLTCNECKMKFRLADEHWDNSQGCSPINLRSRLDDSFIVIRSDDIEKGGRLF